MLLIHSNTIAQNNSFAEAKLCLEVFEGKIQIPSEYKFESVRKVLVDGNAAYLFRFEKNQNKGLAGEHFSFIAASEGQQVLGFTNMDTRYSTGDLPSRPETEKIAMDFLLKMDKSLTEALENLWIERHDEQIVVNEKRTTVAGMKYKCYRASENDYTWVIVGFDGSIVTFERNIKWDNEAKRRITEKWLHDEWQMNALNEIE